MNMILSLLLISVVAAAALAGVYMLTKQSIDKVQAEKKQSAMTSVLPRFSGNTAPEEISLPGDKHPVVVNVARNADGSLFGAAVETYTDKAFGGEFTLMVGFDAQGNILGSEVIKAAETPGLGDKINKGKSNFAEQFVSKNPAASQFSLKVKKDGGDVDAITAATISSRAYCDAVNRAAKAFAQVCTPSDDSSVEQAEPASVPSDVEVEKKGVDNE